MQPLSYLLLVLTAASGRCGVDFSILPGAAPAAGGGPRSPLVPVAVSVRVKPGPLKDGDPIRLAVTIQNGLKGPVTFSTFSLEPNGWNGETVHLTLVDVYRNGGERGLFQSRPKVEPPARIAGMGAYRIEAGQELTIRTDARKWAIDGGWGPGKYRVTVRVEHLSVEDGRCLLGITSGPVEFEVK